jgi:hypothetical protein
MEIKAGDPTAELIDLDPAATVLRTLRDRPDDFHQPEELYEDLARAVAGRIDELAVVLASEIEACRTADAAASFAAQRRYWIPALTTAGGFILAVASAIASVRHGRRFRLGRGCSRRDRFRRSSHHIE